jgi:hypothetical protein
MEISRRGRNNTSVGPAVGNLKNPKKRNNTKR